MSAISVSVIMITYGQEKYITQAIESILMQKTNFEIELIIGDDHPANKSELIVEAIIKNHEKGKLIKYTRHTKNKGIVDNLAWAMQQGKGKYLAICEGDDYWTDPLKLQKQFNYMESNENLVFCFHAALTINDEGERGFYYKSKHFIHEQTVSKKHFIEKGGGGFATASAFFKRSMIEPLPSFYKESSVGDLPLALMALSRGDIGYLRDSMCVYRLMSVNSWSKEITQEQKIENNTLARNTIEKFHLETKNAFKDETNYLIENNIYYSCLYNANGSNLQIARYLYKTGNKMGVKNMLRCIKSIIT